MDKKVNLSAQSVAVRSLSSSNSNSLPSEHQLEFHVIVNCRYTTKVLAAINTLDDPIVSGAAFRMCFFYEMPLYAGCSYDDFMAQLHQQVIATAVNASGLDEEDITDISVATSWKRWEAVTGCSYEHEAEASKVAPHGEFFLPAFYQQIADCSARGETPNDLVWKALAEHYGHTLKAA